MSGITFDFRSQYFHINANAAAQPIKTTPGTVAGISINTKGATANLLTLFDGTGGSAKTIAVIDTTSAVESIDLFYCRFGSLYYTLAGGTAADVTVYYT